MVVDRRRERITLNLFNLASGLRSRTVDRRRDLPPSPRWKRFTLHAGPETRVEAAAGAAIRAFGRPLPLRRPGRPWRVAVDCRPLSRLAAGDSSERRGW